jgi:lactate permease
MPWTQNYDPFGSPLLSTLVAALPVLLLLGLLATNRVSAPMAALAGLVAALTAAIFAFTPDSGDGGTAAWAQTMFAAALHGAAFGLFPIGWIVLSAIFFYSLTVVTGQFDIVKASVVGLSPDRRIQAVLIAFSFGAFLEGAAGFGTPVAISAALLMGAGFKPLYAAGLALIANTSPVAFGALGTPIITLAEVTQLDPNVLSQMAGRQLPFFSLIVPVWLVWTMAGWRATLEVWPALLVAGGSFALVQYLVSNFHGPLLVDVAGGVVSMVALALLLRSWQPRRIWRFPDEPARAAELAAPAPRQIAVAWVPWVVLACFVFLWGWQDFKTGLGALTRDDKKAFDAAPEQVLVRPTTLAVKTPGLHKQVQRGEEVDPARGREAAIFEFNWLSATGSGIFLAALLSAVWMRVPPARVVHIFLATCHRMRWPLFTIACMLAIAFTTRLSGMDATLGLAFTKTGAIYPLFAALLGWLGVALTGSDTSANALFGSLQKITATKLAQTNVLPLGELQAQILMTTANSTGGVMGKMIDAQSIVVSTASTGQAGQEGTILRFVFLHSLVLAALIGLLVLFQAYVWTSVIP